ncbi:hypothetical protein AGMMS49940_21870 [Spirochaetia bacterium]|nr:hypothetical protein AGMMS49940_21870 [Spirochaetia bacterium]
MLGEKKQEYQSNVRQFYQCKSCGKRYTLERRYCDCHTKLEGPIYWTDDPADRIEPKINLEYPSVTCNDCVGKCAYCASYSALETNLQGFGSKDCKHKQNDIKCVCCQKLIENFLKAYGQDGMFNLGYVKDTLLYVGEILFSARSA